MNGYKSFQSAAKFSINKIQDINENIEEIRKRTKDFCVASVAWNLPKEEMSAFKNWYNFLGVSNIYMLDNANEYPIDDAIIKKEKKEDFYDCIKELKEWVRENAKEKYVIFCDTDEFLYVEDASALDHLERHPLAVNWFTMICDLPNDAINSVHPVFSYNTGNYSNTVKTIGKVQDLSDEMMHRSHYSFSKDLKVCNSFGDQKLMQYTHPKNAKPNVNPLLHTVDTDVPKDENFYSIWFLHLKIRSEEHWKKKTHPESQWDYYRRDTFKEWIGNWRIIITDNRHMSWMVPFQKFLLKNNTMS